MPIDVLKIDQSFIADIVTSRQAAALVGSIVKIGQTLDLETVAEGVETEEQLSRLIRLGAKFGQGICSHDRFGRTNWGRTCSGPPVPWILPSDRKRDARPVPDWVEYPKRAAVDDSCPQHGGPVMASKRELIDTGTSKRYIRRDDQGRFTNDQVEVGRASASDQRQSAKTSTRPGQGERGDRKER